MEIPLDPAQEAMDALAVFAHRDVDAMTAAELKAGLEASARLSRLAAVPQAVFAAALERLEQRPEGAGVARRFGHRNVGGMVADTAGSTPGHARDLAAAGGLLAGEPAQPGQPVQPPRFAQLAAAYAAGELSPDKAALVRRTLEQLPEASVDIERRLVARAITLSLAGLKKACMQVTARADVAAWEEREKRMRAERCLSLTQGSDGMVHVRGLLDPASAAPLITVLDAAVKAAFQQRQDNGEGRAPEGEAGRIKVDALVDLTRHAMRCENSGTRTSTTVVVRLSEEAVRTGVGIGECDALGVPISAATARAMAVDAGVLPVMLGGKSEVLDLGRAQRFFTPAQRLALAERDGGCAFCHAPVAWTDAHHIAWWERHRGRTDLANGVLLCTRCHGRIHADGWHTRATASEVWFTPPPDVDPRQRPRLGGKAALEVSAAPD